MTLRKRCTAPHNHNIPTRSTATGRPQPFEGSAHAPGGFTLIELLVVIAIIAILAAILFPVFAQARERSRTVACLSNVGQITRGVMQYANDYNGFWPSCCDFEDINGHQGEPGINTRRYMWVIMKSYTKSDELWRCPSDKGLTWRTGGPNGAAGSQVKNCYKAFGSSYVTNYSNTYYPKGVLKPCKMDQARDLTKAMVVFDVWQTSSNGPDSEKAWNSQWHTRRFPDASWNIGFFDGHAKNLGFQEIRHPKDAPNADTWLFSAYWCRPDAPPGF